MGFSNHKLVHYFKTISGLFCLLVLPKKFIPTWLFEHHFMYKIIEQRQTNPNPTQGFLFPLGLMQVHKSLLWYGRLVNFRPGRMWWEGSKASPPDGLHGGDGLPHHGGGNGVPLHLEHPGVLVPTSRDGGRAPAPGLHQGADHHHLHVLPVGLLPFSHIQVLDEKHPHRQKFRRHHFFQLLWQSKAWVAKFTTKWQHIILPLWPHFKSPPHAYGMWLTPFAVCVLPARCDISMALIGWYRLIEGFCLPIGATNTNWFTNMWIYWWEYLRGENQHIWTISVLSSIPFNLNASLAFAYFPAWFFRKVVNICLCNYMWLYSYTC